MIALTPCSSAAVKAYGYDPVSRTLALRFGAGKVHHYKDVPPDVFESFEAAESKGRAFASFIKPAGYAVEVVADDEKEVPQC